MKKDFRSWKSISRIYLEILPKSQLNPQKKLDIKLEHLTNDDVALKKIKNRKVADLDKIPSEDERWENLMTYFFDYAMPWLTKHNREITKGLHLPLPEKRCSLNH